MARFTDEVRDLVQIGSVSSDGNEEASNWAASLMRERGLKVSVQQVMHSLNRVSSRQFNVIGSLGNPLVERKIRKGLLLVAHLDTVEPGIPSSWTRTGGDPRRLGVKDDCFYGLGTANLKIDFLCKLHAIHRFRERKLRMPVYLVGTCGAETGMYGVKYLIQSLAVNPKHVLVGLPTGLDLVHAHKSAHLFKVSVRYHVVDRDAKGFNRRVNIFAYGKAGPAAVPKAEQNAVLQLLDFLKNANRSGFETRLTRMSGGALLNQIPDRASSEFYLTSHQFEDFKRFFREVSQAPDRPGKFEIELGGLGDTGIGFLPDVLFECLCDLKDFTANLTQQLGEWQDPGYEVSGASVNVGAIHQQPNATELFFDVRLLPGMQEKDLIERVRTGITKLASRYPSLNVSVDLESSCPNLNVPESSEWLGVCKDVLEAAGIHSRLKKTALNSEAGHFAAKGYDVLCFGPGAVQDNLQGPDEFVRLEDIQKATLFYEQLIERVCV